MNEAHWHLAINHLPILGNIFGLFILLISIFWKVEGIKKAGYILLIASGLTAIPANLSGEKAEHKLEKLDIADSHDYLEEHEELAEKGLVICLSIGLLSLIALIVDSKKPQLGKILFYLILASSIGNVWLMKLVGTSGGEIRHTEIRMEVNTNSTEIEKEEHE